MRFFTIILLCALMGILSGCGDVGSYVGDAFNKKEHPVKRAAYGAQSLDKASAAFWRIEASYRVKETDEVLNFNYVVSAYNRDVVGSYSEGGYVKTRKQILPFYPI